MVGARRRVSRSVLLPAAPARVWEAVIDRRQRARWLGVDLEVAAVPGARGSATDERGERRAVVVESVEPGRFSFVWDASPGSRHGPSRVAIAVHAEGDVTRLTVTETAAADLGAEEPRPAATAGGESGEPLQAAEA